MQKLLKNRKIQILGAAVLAVVAICTLVWAYQQDKPAYLYTSIKDDKANPPFEGVYWGMTIPEFCEAMGVEESDLVKAEPFTYLDYMGYEFFVKDAEETYGVSIEDMPTYEHYENHFDVPLNRELLGTDQYYMEDKPQTIRVTFTDETTWNGKTIPPLLCLVVFQAPGEVRQDLYNEFYQFYEGEDAPSDRGGLGFHGGLTDGNVHASAYQLSLMYSKGLSPEEIASYNITARMNKEDIDNLKIKLPDYEAVRPIDPAISSNETVNETTWEVEYVTFYLEAGCHAYYEWFLNELT
ncbi:MAG: hypothetical protein IKU17_00955 [Clostridia bacterium]|nr:hypothetical protein [Clostridia bacterium]